MTAPTVLAEFHGHGERLYRVVQDRAGYYVEQVDYFGERPDAPRVVDIGPDHLAPDWTFETESAAYWYAQGCADGDRRA